MHVPLHLRRLGVLLALAALLVPCCTKNEGDTIVNISDPASEALALSVQGWKAFEAKTYGDAVTAFRGAIAKNDQLSDAYNGLGWSYARMDSLTAALRNFDIALGQQANFLDALAGRSFVSLALGNYEEAIAAVSAIQATRTTFYAFRHDPNVSMDDLLLVKAQSYFFLRDYASARAIIDKLDPANGLDEGSVSYVEDLALEIEQLWQRI